MLTFNFSQDVFRFKVSAVGVSVMKNSSATIRIKFDRYDSSFKLALDLLNHVLLLGLKLYRLKPLLFEYSPLSNSPSLDFLCRSDLSLFAGLHESEPTFLLSCLTSQQRQVVYFNPPPPLERNSTDRLGDA